MSNMVDNNPILHATIRDLPASINENSVIKGLKPIK